MKYAIIRVDRKTGDRVFIKYNSFLDQWIPCESYEATKYPKNEMEHIAFNLNISYIEFDFKLERA